MFTFRLVGHLYCGGVLMLAVILLVVHQDYEYGWWQFVGMWVVGEVLMSWLIDLQIDIAESIQTSLLV